MVRLRLSAALALCALATAGALGTGCADGRARAEAEDNQGPAEVSAVRRGALRPRMLLTGELAASRALELKVPRTRTGQLQIRWMERDGAPVRAGQTLVEFDNSSFTTELEEKRLKASEAADDLERQEAEAEAAAAEKVFLVEKHQTEVAKARLRATLPGDIIAAREVQERQLDLRRAEVELEKARTDLEAHREASAAELKVKRIDLERARREIREAEEAIAALSLRAPRDGMVLAGNHPWEGRKLQEGDEVWSGMTVAILPEMGSMVVEARLSDVDDGRIAPGLEAVCTLDAYPAERFPCRVGEIAPVAREESRNSLRRFFPVRLSLGRVDPRMRPGMSVRVEVLAPEIRGLLVARSALDLSQGRPRVHLSGGSSREVRLGPCAAAECLVESGVEEGARVRVRP